MKYCTYCGQPNEDQALFCTSCGNVFQTQAQPSPSPAPAANPIAPQEPGLYRAEWAAGAHKHMMTDMYLRDSGNEVVLVAKRQSLLHKNYTVVDGTGAAMGQIEEKTHLTHRTFSFVDYGSNTLGAVGVSNMASRGAHPNAWIEDASGNRLADVLHSSFSTFGAYRTDKSSIFEVFPSGGGGQMNAMRAAMTPGPFTVRVNDASFPLPLVLAAITAIATQ